MQKNNKKGVTLLELIIVMVIIAIGAVLVAPNIGAWIPHYRLRVATRDIVSTMRTAQMKAVSQNIRYQVSFTPGTGENGGYILQRDSGGFINDGPMQLLPRGITLETNFQNNNAIFNPNSTSSSGSVTLSNAKAQKRIFLTSTTGRIRIE